MMIDEVCKVWQSGIGMMDRRLRTLSRFGGVVRTDGGGKGVMEKG